MNVLVGFMGAGKTTAARVLDPAAVDSDEVLARELGMPIAAFFEARGEAEFRRREERVVLELLERARPGAALSLGGGALGSERVRAAVGSHRVVWLDVGPSTAWERASGDGSRPLARDRERFCALHSARRPVYERAADVIVAEGVQIALARAAIAGLPPGVRLLLGATPAGPQPVYHAPGVLRSGFAPAPLGARRFVVTDDTVAALHGDALTPHAARIAIPPGEKHKSVAGAARVWSALARAGATRADVLVALGGGVVGDLAGFCAATYQRGLPVVQAPTTLLAQVDSAYGGKTGVDLPEGKNYVGAYHQPAAVLVDPEVLATLPAAEVAAGYAEVVKTALIAGGDLWERVRAGAVADDDVVLACARAKLAVVAEDERDAGRRQVLNLGHTVAHAIETVTAYRSYRHGEAVGLGLLAALRLSGLDGLRAEVEGLLAHRGLPTRLRGAEPAAVLAATRADKKRLAGGEVPFVLVRAPGDVLHGCPVSDAEALAAIGELAG